MSLDIRMSEEEDAAILAPNLRDIDTEEIWCASGLGPLEALNQAFELCDICNTVTLDDEPIAMYGVTVESWGAIPWLLGSEALESVKVSMAKISTETVDRWVEKWGTLRNYVHAENTQSIRWLRDHLLFEVSEKTIVLRGSPFRMFERTK